jgi:hypothetical protein
MAYRAAPEILKMLGDTGVMILKEVGLPKAL